MRGRSLLLGAVALIGWQGAWAQDVGKGVSEGVVVADSVRNVARRRFWVRPVASFVLPGSGQILSHQNRAAAYLVAELYTLVRYLQLTHRGEGAATAFRDLAFNVARRSYSPVQHDTAWDYFEKMEHYASSGQYNLGSPTNLVPETDTTTYNGVMWLLARRTFWRDPSAPPNPTSPEYASAVQFYQAHAVSPGFLWSWSGADSALTQFRATIAKSDNAFRSAQDQLGLLLANHLASAVDALISSRLASAAKRPALLQTSFAPGHFSFQISFAF